MKQSEGRRSLCSAKASSCAITFTSTTWSKPWSRSPPRPKRGTQPTTWARELGLRSRSLPASSSRSPPGEGSSTCRGRSPRRESRPVISAPTSAASRPPWVGRRRWRCGRALATSSAGSRNRLTGESDAGDRDRASCVSSLTFDKNETESRHMSVKRLALQGQASRSYGNLLRELAITEYKVKYQGSLLSGYVWSFAKPLLLFGVLYFVFTRFVKLGAGVPDYALQLLLGIVIWSYFADATVRGMSSIVDRGDLIRKVYFPRMIIVVAASLSSLITLALNLVVVVAFFLFSGVGIHLTMPLFLLLIVELYALTLGTSFLLAALYVRFRDFRHIWELGLQLLFYATPIIYPLSFIPANWQAIFSLNPIAQIVQDSRKVLISSTTLAPLDVLHSPLVVVPYAIPVIVLVLGYLYFDHAAAAFAEEI